MRTVSKLLIRQFQMKEKKKNNRAYTVTMDSSCLLPDQEGSTDGRPVLLQTWPEHWLPTSGCTAATTHQLASLTE